MARKCSWYWVNPTVKKSIRKTKCGGKRPWKEPPKYTGVSVTFGPYSTRKQAQKRLRSIKRMSKRGVW